MGVIQTLDGLMNNPTPEGRVDDILRPEGDNPLLEKGFVTTSVDALLNWARTGSMWPMTFGLACCAVKVQARGAGVHHLDRAAGQTEGHRPHRAGARPVQQCIDAGGDEALF